jgi:hypothetical protein
VQFLFLFMTNDPDLARDAERAGVEWIGPDLETIGKDARQGDLGTRISRHTIEDVARIRDALQNVQLFVRVNPIHPGSPDEIERVLDAGARVIMLPMFRTAQEASRFISLLGGRAKSVLLVETPEAMMRIHEILAVDGIEEVYFGLNDLRLALNLHSHFEVLSSELMDGLAEAVKKRNLPYGFGGVARVHDFTLPIPADQVVGEIVRLGAARALLSRYFFPRGAEPFDFTEELRRTRGRISYWRRAGAEALLDNRRALRESVRKYREGYSVPTQTPGASN